MNADSDDCRSEPWEAPGDPGAGRTVLLIIDMLNDYEHDDGDVLRENAGPVVPVIARLARRAMDAGALVVWVNDNHDDWAASRESLLDAARAAAGTEGAELIDPIAPHEAAPFLVKSRHSAFYGSALEHLLHVERIERVVLTGQVTEQCILYTALDAYLRRFRLTVARDGVVAIDPELADAALRMMARNMRAEVLDADEIDF